MPPTIPFGFEALVHEHIRRTSGKDRDHLTGDDFHWGQGVRLSFSDGSFAFFEYAFFIEDPLRELVAIFTEHCGYHVFSSVELRVDTVKSISRGSQPGGQDVIPEVISAMALEKDIGGTFTCPLCIVQSSSDSNDIGWVAMRELLHAPKWICLGCWIDVSSITRFNDPARHSGYEDLVRLAGMTGMPPEELTDVLLQRQLSILQTDPETVTDPQLKAMKSRIETLLNNVDG